MQSTAKVKTKVKRAVNFIKATARRKKLLITPNVAIILGTGLGGLAREIQPQINIPYARIPHFPISTGPSHKSQLILGTLNNQPVVAMEGRFHYYEGYTLEQITLPVRVMQALGANVLIIASAVGSMNPDCPAGSIVLVKDHINLMGINPLIGPNDESLGPRFPDMYETYNHDLLALAQKVAQQQNIQVQSGIYAALTGPNLETPAEYKYLRIVGADVVGMSMVPEAIVGVHGGLKILGITVVTDLATPETVKPVNIQEIIEIAEATEPKMTDFVKGLVSRLNEVANKEK